MARPLLTLALLLSASLACLQAQNAPAAAQPRVNTVYISVTREDGAPVLDIGLADITVKEDGKARDVLKVSMATAPMQVMIIVDDNGTGVFRSGVLQFVQHLQGRAEVALSAVVGQTQKLVDYTTDLQRVVDAAATLSARPATHDGGQLLEAIFQSAKDQQRRELGRPVIVALTVGGEEHSTVPAHHVLEELAKSRSALYVISVVNNSLRPTVGVNKPAALLQENLNLHEVLGDGPRQSGGWHEQITASPGIVLGLQRIATELRSQYAVEYSRPPKGKSIERLNVSLGRRGLMLRAPTKVPGR